MAAPPGRHRPGLPRSATRSVDLVAAGLGSGNTLSRHTSVSAFISQSFDQHPRSGRRLRRCAWVLLRGDIIAAAGPCVTSRLARHDCSLYFSPATETSARLCVSAGVRFCLQVRRRRLPRAGWAAALSSCSMDIIAAGHLLGSSQDTHNLAHFLVCVRDLSCVANPVALTRVDLTTRLDLRSSWSWLVVSCFVDVARSVIIVFKCASIAPNLPCPSLHIIVSWLRRVLVFTSWNFVSPEVLLPADDITAYEYLLTLRVF